MLGKEALQMRKHFIKLAFHTSCSGARSYGISNWCYLTGFLTAARANSQMIYNDSLVKMLIKVPA